MEKTERRIAYKAGITRTPSDFLCEDGELAECINLTTDHEELKVAPQPEKFMTTADNIRFFLLYVHKVKGGEVHYIGYVPFVGESVVYWGTRNDNGVLVRNSYALVNHVADAESLQITSIGNTLIVSDGSETNYYLWKPDDNDYLHLGNKIPEPKMRFILVNGKFKMPDKNERIFRVVSVFNDSCIEFHNIAPHSVAPVVTNQGVYNNLVIGMWAKLKESMAKTKYFIQPFLVRYAVELYDGSYIYQSAPILMQPGITCNCIGVYYKGLISLESMVYQLAYRSEYNYSLWDDIVKGVTVFISNDIELYDTGIDQVPLGGQDDLIWTDSWVSPFDDFPRPSEESELTSGYYHDYVDPMGTETYCGFLPLSRREESAINDDIKSTSVFYKLFEAGLKGNNKWESTRSKIKSHVLDNITTQEQLEDDYFSHCPLSAKRMISYNNRLILANVSRGFFSGFEHFAPNFGSFERAYQIFVYIDTPSGERVINKQIKTTENLSQHFYYPDPRAYRAVIYEEFQSFNIQHEILYSYDFISDLKLTEHPYLHGARADGAYTESATPTIEQCQAAVDETPEILGNEIFQSEVDNPFVFRPRGNKTVGTGDIVAIATLTKALSQGQFGQYPVVAFTTEGIWSMSIDGEGYLEPAQPMSREVCINDRSVLEADESVFFVSKKGLMLVEGGDVRCVTEQMNGLACNTDDIGDPVGTGTEWRTIIDSCADGSSFLQYIRDKDCFMAYDYIDSKVLIMNKNYTYSYLYNIADGNVSKVLLPGRIIRAVNAYPDYYLQDGEYDANGKINLYSLYNKKDETEVTGRHLAFLLTRPMKLSGPVGVSSLRELVNVGFWDKEGGSVVKTQVFLSSNLHDWYEMGSRFGAPAKYFRVALYVKLMATERLSGTIIRYQERRDDNVRV